MCSEWDDEKRKSRLSTTILVATAWGYKLYELFDVIVIVVNVVLEVTVQGSGLPATVQEVAVLKLEVFIISLEVIILREEPALVKKFGVTVKRIEESEFFMSSSF